jgi:predicted nucleic acid-binding protein
MRRVFADSLYWIAVAAPKDQWHARVVEASRALQGARIITTEEVMIEFLNAFRHNADLRRAATVMFRGIQGDPGSIILSQSHQSFLAGYGLYEARPDKAYSLTDCIPMAAMRQEGIAEVLSHDRHFTQEGFTILL